MLVEASKERLPCVEVDTQAAEERKSPGEARCGREDRLTPSEDEHRKEHKVVVQCGNEALVDDASAHYRQVLSHPHHDDHTDLKPAP